MKVGLIKKKKEGGCFNCNVEKRKHLNLNMSPGASCDCDLVGREILKLEGGICLHTCPSLWVSVLFMSPCAAFHWVTQNSVQVSKLELIKSDPGSLKSSELALYSTAGSWISNSSEMH
ncbi:hypothetical protein AMECASPLE_017151 [Ameca splendens]|uniref:Uncharacterized protein n=1 Tax=Ameca splendens TaxID=208324 RepID=A0ABV0ZZD9_9TELE